MEHTLGVDMDVLHIFVSTNLALPECTMKEEETQHGGTQDICRDPNSQSTKPRNWKST